MNAPELDAVSGETILKTLAARTRSWIQHYGYVPWIDPGICFRNFCSIVILELYF